MRIRIGDLLVKAGGSPSFSSRPPLPSNTSGRQARDHPGPEEFLTEEVLVRALSKETGIARADLTGDPDVGALCGGTGRYGRRVWIVADRAQGPGRTLLWR